MNLKTDDTFFGVYNRHGELEAVESSMGLAVLAAAALSPGRDGAKQVTRIVQRVRVTPLDTTLSTPVASEVQASTEV